LERDRGVELAVQDERGAGDAREVVARVADRELEARGEHVPSLRLLRPGGQVLDRLRRVRLEEVLVRLPGGDLRPAVADVGAAPVDGGAGLQIGRASCRERV